MAALLGICSRVILGRRADWLPELGQHTNPEGASQRFIATVQGYLLSASQFRIQRSTLTGCQTLSNRQCRWGRLKAYVEWAAEPQKVDIPVAIQLSNAPASYVVGNGMRVGFDGDEKPRKRLDKNNGFQAKVDQTAKDDVLG